MENSNQGWMSTAETFIVDGIVSALKNHPAPDFCWSRTGPSLRRLNKHWCREMNRHIAEIVLKNHYHEEGVQSLLKFPNLTSLNTSAFDDPEKNSLLAQTLHKIPKLNRLAISRQLLESVKRDDLEGLKCETVELISSGFSVAENGKVLNNVSAIRMEEFRLNSKYPKMEEGWVPRLLADVPSVKRLAIQGDHSEADFETLAKLEGLEMTYRGNSLYLLAMLTSLVSLDLYIQLGSFEAFNGMERLRILRVEIVDGFVFDRAFYNVFRRLKEMSIFGKARDRSCIAFPCEIWEESNDLEHLGFCSLSTDMNQLDHVCFKKLRSLNLCDCEFEGGTIPWNRLTSLACLNLYHSNHDTEENPILGAMDLSPLRKLRCLSLRFYNEKDISVELLQSIRRLSNLEELFFYQRGAGNLGHLKPVLLSLTELPHLMKTNMTEFISEISV